jgi:glycosyltransferase involved in cell wall biosynthesis
MKVLFLSISQTVSNLENKGIYPDLIRKFAKEGHDIYIVAPAERRLKENTNIKKNKNVTILHVKTPNITKTNKIEQGLSTILIPYLYIFAINKYLKEEKYELVLYSTPPITFNKIIRRLKKEYNVYTYLLLKDIFPQNAVDLGLMSKSSYLYKIFRKKEIELYNLSDYIGCMSPANVEYIKRINIEIPENKIEVCPNSILPVNVDKYIDKDNYKEKMGLPKDKVLFIYGGNLGKGQGIGFLLDVLKYYKDNNNISFVIAGSGTDSNRIKNYIEEYKIENVVFYSQLPKEQYDELLQVCDVGMIFLDKRFTIPNYPSRLLNYLEYEKPILMAIDRNTDIGKIAEENSFGFWVESGDMDNFNKKINILLQDKIIRKQMGRKGREYLMKNYTVDKSYEIIMAHFLS